MISDHHELLDQFCLDPTAQEALNAFVRVIRIKEPETYLHSVHTAEFLVEIIRSMHLDPKVGLFAGLLHDYGKVQCDPAILHKKTDFTPEDLEHVTQHVLDGYRALRGLFDFTAEVILWHHRFQARPYPDFEPPPLHDYSTGTRVMIPLYGRLLAIADFYEATHRRNDRYGEMDGVAIRRIVEEHNRDLATLVTELYGRGIFDDTLGTGYAGAASPPTNMGESSPTAKG